MLSGINIKQRIEFISKYDDSEPKTKFVFRPLSGADMLELGTQEKSFILRALDSSIVSIENTPEDMEKYEFIRTLPGDVLNELFQKFNEINNILEQDEKN